MTFEETMTNIVDGFKLMSMTGAILVLAWSLGSVTKSMGLGCLLYTSILERMVLTDQVCQLIVYLGAVLNGTCTLADLDIYIGAQCLLCQSGIMA